jgi:predicted Fe-Mo cluster-binding NifX family protein
LVVQRKRVGTPIALFRLEVLTLRIAIPVWEGRVSPVLDVAENLLLVEVDAGHEVSRNSERFDPCLLPQRARRFSGLGVDIVICGAISRPLAEMLSASGITVLPCIIGEVEDVLRSYLDDGVPDSRFFMPGYTGPPRRRRQHGRRRRFDRY